MTKKNTYQTYGSVSKFFHWAIFILVAPMLIYGFLLSELPKTWQPMAYNIHKLVGLMILLLMIFRLLWAFTNPKPKLPNTTPLWQIAAERLLHFGFYMSLLAMPIAGWITASAAGRAPKLLGYVISLPITSNENLAERAADVHTFLAYVIIAMIALHTLAALKHHFINKDNILLRMMPGKNIHPLKRLSSDKP